MHFVSYTAAILIGMVASTMAAGGCDSGLNHNIYTHCDNQGNWACSGADRGYVLYCGTNLWLNDGDCPSGTGCHNCACVAGY